MKLGAELVIIHVDTQASRYHCLWPCRMDLRCDILRRGLPEILRLPLTCVYHVHLLNDSKKESLGLSGFKSERDKCTEPGVWVIIASCYG